MKQDKLYFTSEYKGIMLLLVILGHSCILYTGFWSSFESQESSIFFDFFTRWLDSFHTYAFVFVSGFIYYYLKYEKHKYTSDSEIIRKKIKRLLIPYALTCCFWAIPTYCFLFESNLTNILERYVLGENPDQLWFLLMLFWVFAISIGLGKFFDFGTQRFVMDLTVMGGCFALYLFSIIVSYLGIPNYYRVTSAFTYEVFFVIGMVVCKYSERIFKTIFSDKKQYCVIILCSAFISLLISLLIYTNVIKGILKYLISPIGTLAAIAFTLVKVMKKTMCSQQRKMWKWFCDNSFIVYLLHQQIIYFSLSFVNRSGIPPVCVVCVNFVVSIVISGLISLILSALKKRSGVVAAK